MSKLQAVSPLYVLFKGENLRRFSGESQFLPPLRKAFQMTVLHAGVDEHVLRMELRRI